MTELSAPAQQHSETSVAAAEAIESKSVTLRRVVLAAIKAAGDNGLTDEEGQNVTGIGGNCYRPRRVELTTLLMVRDSGLTRKTVAGRKAVVWVAA